MSNAQDKTIIVSSKSKCLHFAGVLLFFALAAVLLGMVTANFEPPRDFKKADIAAIWGDGNAIAHGNDPYSRIRHGNMLTNEKYTTYFPGFYVLVAALEKAGVVGIDNFEAFTAFWRIAEICLVLLSGAVLYQLYLRSGSHAFAVFGAGLFMLNRWTLTTMTTEEIDIIAVLFLLLSLFFYESFPRRSLVLLGVSLAFKQIAIVLVPLYIILGSEACRSVKEWIVTAVKNALLIAAVPLVLSVPFLIWDAEGFIHSILFSATRLPEGHLLGVADQVGATGFVAKIPAVAALLLVYLFAWRRQVKLYSGSLLAFFAFTSFNSVYYSRYMVWCLPFAALTILEILQRRGLAKD